jgi:hypothetical protein
MVKKEEEAPIPDPDIAKSLRRTDRTQITDKRRMSSFSKRALHGKMDVIKRKCPFCSHHKMFNNFGKMKCCKCGRNPKE